MTATSTGGQGGRASIVAFGDSLTSGHAGDGVTYPGALQETIDADPRLRGAIRIVNRGVPGNRVLHDGYGPSALKRFDRDVLAVPGVTAVILCMGINDIQLDAEFPKERVTVEQLTGGLASLLDKAKTAGIRAFAGTIPPWRGSAYFTPEREAVRQAVNAWLRSGAAADADAIFDFDGALRDQADLSLLNSRFDSGDHLHPNAAGYRAMAGAIGLAVFG